MTSEQNVADQDGPQAEASNSSADGNAKKPRSPREKAIVWGLISVLVLTLGLEYRGRTGYSQSLTELQDALEKNRQANGGASTLKLKEAINLLSMAPSVSDPKDGNPPEVVASWFTLTQFLPDRAYRIHLELDRTDNEPHLIGVATAADFVMRDDVITLAASPAGQPASTPARMTQIIDGRTGMAMGPVGELGRSEVLAALGVTDEQAAELTELAGSAQTAIEQIRQSDLRPNEVTATVAGLRKDWDLELERILGKAKRWRLEEITIQAEGPAVFARPHIADWLKLENSQRDQIKGLRDAFESSQGASDVTDEQRAEARRLHDDELLGVLTESQKNQWAEMQGRILVPQ